jgi:hypothetical protein
MKTVSKPELYKNINNTVTYKWERSNFRNTAYTNMLQTVSNIVKTGKTIYQQMRTQHCGPWLPFLLHIPDTKLLFSAQRPAILTRFVVLFTCSVQMVPDTLTQATAGSIHPDISPQLLTYVKYTEKRTTQWHLIWTWPCTDMDKQLGVLRDVTVQGNWQRYY